MNDEQLKYIFAPLDSIDLRSFLSIAESLRKAKDKNQRAIGAFLYRVYKHWMESSPDSETPGSKESNLDRFSGLSDLR